MSEYQPPLPTADTTRITALWPDTRNGTTQAIIDQCRGRGFLPPSIVGFANESEWRRLVGSQPPEDGPAKYWRSDYFSHTGKPHLWLCIAMRNPDGQFATISPIPTGLSKADETFNFLSPTAAKYVQQHSKAVKKLPMLKLWRVSASGGQRISFAPGVPTDFPIAEMIEDEGGPIQPMNDAMAAGHWAAPAGTYISTEYPRLRVANGMDGNWFPRINEDGDIEYCKCQGFAADDESSDLKYTNAELAMEAFRIIGTDLTTDRKGELIRQAAMARKG